MKKKKKSIEDRNDLRMKKVLKITVIIAAVILIVEAIIFGLFWYKNYRSTTYYDGNSMVVLDDGYRFVVGSSDFKNSLSVDYTKGIEKGKFAKYDKNGNLLWEKSYDEGFNSTFSAVATLNGFYYVAGSAEFTDYQKENGIREAILIKYDKDGNKVWQQRFTVLSNSRFLDILVEDDGIVVVGQSIYENLELGNHTTGGGIIAKYDFDGNLLWSSNYGGNKSGIFRDVKKVDGGYVTVGRDARDTGIVVFFDETGERKWQRNYSYTDNEGFQSLVVNENDIYVVGSKKIWTDTGNEEIDNQRNAKNTDAVIVKYDINGKMLWEKSFGGSSYERYQNIYLEDNSLYLVGHTTSTDTDLKVTTVDDKMTGLIVKTDLDGNILTKNIYGGSGNDNLLYLTKEDDHFIAVGLSDSKDGTLKNKKQNGKDYYGQIVTFDNQLYFKD